MAKSVIVEIEPNVFRVTEQKKILTEYGERLKDVVRIVKDPIDIWIIGNTGMRNPWRIPSGFKVYAESNMVGRIREADDQVAFKKILLEKGEIGGDEDKDVDASITRKYRLMFNKYGFAYPEIKKKDGFEQSELGPVDAITPLGETFYKADTVAAQQECFLRGLIVPMEKLTESSTFSPLLWVVTVMMELEKRTGDTKLNFIEFATCVQTSTPLCDVSEVVDEILSIREERTNAENKKKYDRELIDRKCERYLKQDTNFKDYADMNIRYLVSAGIVKRAGRGMMLSPEYHSMAIELIKDVVSNEPLLNRYKKLCNGAPLPTDNQDMATKVLNDMIAELDYYKIDYQMPDIPLDSAKNINLVRNTLKKNIDKFKEEQYALRQVNDWEEIYEYMSLLIVNNGKEKELGDDYTIKVSRSEAAAYLEWILWRAFLAIDHIVNKPYEARGFNIDQDYLPVGTAPGGGPDMIFEFEDFTIVVEVTMSTNSRQEAMEGEPVRRHVADIVMGSDKPVYGVFDMFVSNNHTPKAFLNMFEMCFESKENKEGPQWKGAIEKIVSDAISG